MGERSIKEVCRERRISVSKRSREKEKKDRRK